MQGQLWPTKELCMLQFPQYALTINVIEQATLPISIAPKGFDFLIHFVVNKYRRAIL